MWIANIKNYAFHFRRHLIRDDSFIPLSLYNELLLFPSFREYPLRLNFITSNKQNFNKKCTRKTIKVLVHWLHVNRHVAWIQMSIWHLELRQHQSNRNWYQWEKQDQNHTEFHKTCFDQRTKPKGGWIETSIVVKILQKWYCDCQL